MNPDFSPSVIAVELFSRGVLVTFEGGRSALYPAALLYKTISDAEEVEALED